MRVSEYLKQAADKKLTVKRKDTGRVVHVSPETLQKNKEEYAPLKEKPGDKPAVKPKPGGKPKATKKTPAKAPAKPKPVKVDPAKLKTDPKHQKEVVSGVGKGMEESAKSLKADVKESLPPKKQEALSSAVEKAKGSPIGKKAFAEGKPLRALLDLGLDVASGWVLDKVLKPYISSDLGRGLLAGALGGILAGVVKKVITKLVERKPKKEAVAAAEDGADEFLGLLEEEMQGLASKLSSGKMTLKAKK